MSHIIKAAALTVLLGLFAPPAFALTASDAQAVLASNKTFMCDTVIDHGVIFEGYETRLSAAIELRAGSYENFYGTLTLRSDADGTVAGQQYEVSGSYSVQQGEVHFPFKFLHLGQSVGTLPGNGEWRKFQGDMILTSSYPGNLAGSLNGEYGGYIQFDCHQ